MTTPRSQDYIQTCNVVPVSSRPGAVDTYQVNFRVPPDISPGAAAIQISAAWIPGAPVII